MSLPDLPTSARDCKSHPLGNALLRFLSASTFLSARCRWRACCVSTHAGPRVLENTVANFSALSSDSAWRHRCCSSVSSDLALAHTVTALFQFALLWARSVANFMLTPESSEASPLLARSICVTRLAPAEIRPSLERARCFHSWNATKFLGFRVVRRVA